MNAIHESERCSRQHSSAIAGSLLLVHFAFAAFFLYLFDIRFYRWRDQFNELGRAYDPDGSGQVYTTGGMFWILPAGIFFLLGAWQFVRLLRCRKTRERI